MSDENKSAQPVKRQRVKVPIALTRVRTGPAWGDAIEIGDEIPEAVLKGAPQLVEGVHYEMGAYVK